MCYNNSIGFIFKNSSIEMPPVPTNIVFAEGYWVKNFSIPLFVVNQFFQSCINILLNILSNFTQNSAQKYE